jgi:SAM-dependent methyltransferase
MQTPYLFFTDSIVTLSSLHDQLNLYNLMLNKILFSIKSRGIFGLVSSIRQYIFPVKAMCFSLCEKHIANKVGLEVGGPSIIFKRTGVLPVYSIIKHLDNCNFSCTTTWEGSINEGLNFSFDENSPIGKQYVAEATDLSKINSSEYDFVLSSHMLEHTANPLKALSEWTRILKDDGFLILILPHKDGIFDHQRPVTTLDHIIEDFECGIQEDDLTHLPEILKLHDFSIDQEAGTLQAFRERSEKNSENRCLHHHVFDTNLAIKLLHYQQLQIHAVEVVLPCHIILIAQKVSSEEILNNKRFTEYNAECKILSPFHSDKLSDK